MHLEPNYYRWEFSHSTDVATLKLYYVEEICSITMAGNREKRESLELEFTGQHKDVLFPIWRGIKEFSSRENSYEKSLHNIEKKVEKIKKYMNQSTLFYSGTNELVLPGDTIQIKRILRPKVNATVTYIPNVSKYDSENGNDQWSYKVDGGGFFVIGYDSQNKHFTSKRVSLISRANDKEYQTAKNTVAPPELKSEDSIISELLWLFSIALGIVHFP